MSGMLQDVRYALRQLRKNPGFTAVVVITLALGIGANTAIFSVVNALLLRPLPYKDDSRLVVILHNGSNPVAPANFEDWRSQNHVFESMGAAQFWTPNLTDPSNPEKLWGLQITADILPMLKVEPLLGRVFLPEEQEAGKEDEVVLSYSLWQSHFAGDPHVIGRSLPLSGRNYTVVGVMPREFRFAPFWATKAELWAPLALGKRVADREGNSLRVFARLKPGVTLEKAQAEMAAIAARLEQQYPGTNRDVDVISLREKVVGNIRPTLLVLLGAAGFVLLIACANVGHMMMARVAARQREVAVRSALGAQRWDVVRQLLIESLALSMSGGALGVLFAMWGVRVLPVLGAGGIPRVDTISVDSHVLLFALALSVFTGLAFGVAPSGRVVGANVLENLKEGERGAGEGVRRNRLRSLLMSSEFAFAVVLLAGAGLMVRTFIALQNVDPGFDPHHVLSMTVGVAWNRAGLRRAYGSFLSAGAAERKRRSRRAICQRNQSPSACRRSMGLFVSRPGAATRASRRRAGGDVSYGFSRLLPHHEDSDSEWPRRRRSRQFARARGCGDQRLHGSPILAGRRRHRQTHHFQRFDQQFPPGSRWSAS